MKAIIMAAGMGTRIRPLSEDCPKCLLRVGPKSLLQMSLDNLRRNQVHDVVIIVGYLKDAVMNEIGHEYGGMAIQYALNDEYEYSSTMNSLYKAKNYVDDDVLILEGDILYEANAIKFLLESKSQDATIVTQLSGSDDEAYIFVDQNENLIDVQRDYHHVAGVFGELVGITKLSKKSLNKLFELAAEDVRLGIMNRYYEDALLRLSKITPIKCILRDIVWIGVNNQNDYALARNKLLRELKERS